MKNKIIFGVIIIVAVIFFIPDSIKAQIANIIKNKQPKFSKQNYPIEYKKINKTESYEKITIQGDDSIAGFYDPSVEYGNDNIGWLVYSGSGSTFKKAAVDTHLAKTTDGGKTWTKVNNIQLSSDETIVRKKLFTTAKVKIRRRHETPTLLYDPYDSDPKRKWKLFWVTGPADLSFGIGKLNQATIWSFAQISYKYASSPEKLAAAKEIKLFGSAGLNSCLSDSCRVKYNLNNFNTDIKNTAFYLEPGSMVKDGVIYLTLTAVSVKDLQKTILLSSKDHGETWEYIGTLTTKDELLPKTPPERSLLTSSSLAEENGRIFLLASPRSKTGEPGEYGGIYVFEFEDIGKAKLRRDGNNNLIVHKYLPAIDSTFVGGGQSEYHSKNTYGGIIISQTDNTKKGQSGFFQIYNTREKIVMK